MKRGPDCSAPRFWGRSATVAVLAMSLLASTSQMAQAVSPTDKGLGITNAQGANIHLLGQHALKVHGECLADSRYELNGSLDKVNPVIDAIKNRQDAPKGLTYTLQSTQFQNSYSFTIDLMMPVMAPPANHPVSNPPGDSCSDAGLAKYGLKYAQVKNSLEPDWWKGFVAAFAAFATYATITFAISGLMVLAAGPAIEFWAARIGGCVGGGASNLVANLIMGIQFNGKLMTSTIGNCIFGGIGPKVFGEYLPKFITWVDTSFTGWVLRAAGKWLRQWLSGVIRTGATQVRTVIEMVGQEFACNGVCGGRQVPLNAAMALPSAPVQPVTPADELVGAASNRCMSNPTTSATNGVQLQILDCVNGTNQQITSDGSALQLLGKCLDVGQQATTPGTPVQLWTCWGGAGQQWTVNTDGTIVGVASGLCLGVAGGATANASKLDMETCTGGSSQNWSTGSATASAVQQFQHIGSGLCLSNPTTTATIGVQLQILDCVNGTNQQISSDGTNLEVLGRCIDVQGQHTTPGTVVQLYTCNGGSNQQWTVNPDGTIVGVGSGLCLAVAGSASATGSGLDIEACDGSANQDWVNAPSTVPVQQYSDAGSGRCVSNPTTAATNGVQLQILDCANTTNQQISSIGSALQVLGKCFDVQGRHTTPGTVVQLYTCNGGTNQQWTFNDDGTVVGVGSGLCLGVAGGQTANGSGLDIETCNGASSQIWANPSSRALQLVGQGSGLCVTDPGPNATTGTQLQILDCIGDTNQQLTAIGGTLQMQGTCLNVPATAAGTPVSLSTCNGGANQQWTLNDDGTIVAGTTGLCLGVAGSATAAGSGLDIETCNGSSNQVWLSPDRGPSAPTAIQYYGAGSGLCLSNPTTTATNGVQQQMLACANGTNQEISFTGGTLQVLGSCLGVQSTASGTAVTLNTCNAGAGQQWTVNDDGTIVGVQSGLCLGVVGSQTASGSPVDIETCNGGSNQQWSGA